MVDPQWITGFTDGEGCFSLFVHKDRHKRKTGADIVYYRWNAVFIFGLRGDDIGILEKIKNYFKVGYVTTYFGKETEHLHAYGKCSYSTRTLKELVEVIIPHFDTYPLESKKQADYILWREAVLLLAESRAGTHKLFNKIQLSESTKARLLEIHNLMRKRVTGSRTTWEYKNLEEEGIRKTLPEPGQLNLL